MIRLISIDKIRASTYNPRKSDPHRLNLLELSLRKLGFVSPIVVDEKGEIISGHQRSYVARRMGVKMVPVLVIGRMPLERRKSLNIVFNRATNDLKRSDTCATITEHIKQYDVEALGNSLPDLEIGSPEFYPCMHTQLDDTFGLMKKNAYKVNQYAKNLASVLIRFKCELPVILDPEDNVVNGIGRLMYYASKKIRAVSVIRVSAGQAKFADLMLNYLSMDFDIQSRYADTLRYNSFMRSRNTRNGGLGCGFYKGLWPHLSCEDIMGLRGQQYEEWVGHFGNSIVDFGAGKLNNTRILREAGLSVSAFEPYFLAIGEEISKKESRKIILRFLEEIADGREFSAIFISSVFNSVPFMADRKCIATICSALSTSNTICVCWTQGVNSGNNIGIANNSANKTAVTQLTFNVDYEPNVVLGDFSALPKVQKYHTKKEIYEIFSEVYDDVYRLDLIDDFCYLEARKPKLDVERLSKALEFEFNLPYPDGTRMGLVDEAKAAFSKRLGIEIK